ncbi:MAG: choice-of-anchor tandem repeat GloVer-containing protein [Rhizomicrobium sp.]|jgi:uncharacterized repeat protein (TIGR03803 family)
MKTVSIALLAGIIGCAFVQPGLAASAAKYTEKVVWSFGNGMDGQAPDAGLIAVRGTLYGTTEAGGGGISGRGTVFALDPSTGDETVLYSFCSQLSCTDGALPEAGLITVNGMLYGTTVVGGADDRGTVFSLDPSTGSETVVYSFCSQQNCADGEMPEAGLIEVEGTLYGTAYADAVFALDPNTGAETVLYSFCSQMFCTDGAGPVAGVIDVKGILYGTTSLGGANTGGCNEEGCGEVFSVNPNTGAETVLHSFGSGADGQNPLAGLIDVNGTFYGTTSTGGGTRCNCGTVFSLDPKTGAEKVIYAFLGGKDGANPYAGLIDVKGTLYGTTYTGGGTGCKNVGTGCGTVFSIDPKTGAEKVLYSFCSQQNCTDGATPEAGLVDVSGTLYGTTNGGGSSGHGTVFALTKKP